ncbi:MAG: DUF1624 domain-containing protein [Bacteroidetes bacterium]|nr:DUF1624 domain-containing protein [Bacteroidota bacterium]
MNTAISRNQTADVLKGLAVIFMIQVHIMEQFASITASTSWIGKIAYFLGGPFCAPVFIGVMGYFLAVSNQSFPYFLKRGIVLFLGGILLNIVRSIHLFITIIHGKYNLDTLFFIFGADILTLAGLSVLLIGFLRLISKKSLFLYIPILLLFAVSGNLIAMDKQAQNLFLNFVIGESDPSYFPLFPWFSYVLLAYIFKLIYDKYQSFIFPFSKFHWISVALLSLIILIFTPYAFSISLNLSVYYHHSFVFFLWVIGFMLLYVLFINYLNNKFKNTKPIRYLSWTGKNVTVIYVIQWIIIGNIATAIYATQNLINSELWFIGITLLSCALTFLFLKIKDYYKIKNEIFS